MEQKQQLEALADENCLVEIVDVQSKIFQGKPKLTLEKVNCQLKSTLDTFILVYELPTNLPGLQWTGLELRLYSPVRKDKKDYDLWLKVIMVILCMTLILPGK